MIWAAEYIGSGEVIIATRTGAVLGTAAIWAVVGGIFLKYWIGMSGARYTVCTGEGMIDMIGRMPGPRNWAVWIVLVAQTASGALAIGSLASAAGVFLNTLVPVSPYFGGWIITIVAVAIVWSGEFKVLKFVMSILVFVIVLGVMYVAVQVFPGAETFFSGFIPQTPDVPDWAVAKGASDNPWEEILPLLGWGAGGFASQVWYTYWVLGAGYGAAQGRPYGKSADLEQLQKMTVEDARKIKGWCKVVYSDATIAMLIGVLVTLGFLTAGYGILGAKELLPDGEQVAVTLSNIFGNNWGETGAFLFMLGGTAALLSTQIGQLAGWPRLLADSFRLCIPGFGRRFKWKTQFRGFLILFLITNMTIVYTLGHRPVFLVKMGALVEGLLLTPLQALWVALGLFIVMPKMLNDEANRILKPHPVFAVGLAIAFIVFGYFCVFQLPKVL